ncbi:MAG TPA: MoxR family ATPase [Candidatus Polarisedimenticolia bacterium]|nr:MoxR family ATPase [Candidatus Polarisedimenticolia bacterium]
MEQIGRLVGHVRTEMERVVVGQREAIDQMILCLLCGGHAILEGVPGLAKTLSVKAMARLLQVSFQRVQCTPDLMPADVIGTNIFNPGTAQFALRPGPVFTDLLLVDEINRTPPRTQSALLEAMEERQVTIDGERYPLSELFTVFATLNPVEFEGTYPLPEAQLDRFLVKILIDYPAAGVEEDVLKRYEQGFDARDIARMDLAALPAGAVATARRELGGIRVEDALVHYIATLVRRTREWPSVSLGASPRGAIGLLGFAKAVAAVEGRDFVIPDDVKAIARPVLRHRVILKPEAQLESVTPDQVVDEIVRSVAIPK